MNRLPWTILLIVVIVGLVIGSTIYETLYVQDVLFRADLTYRVGDATNRALQIYTQEISDGTYYATISQIYNKDDDSAANIKMLRMAGSTYVSLQEWCNLFQSSGFVSGGTITDSGSGEIDVAAGCGVIKVTDDELGETRFFDWAAQSNIALTNNATNYIYGSYNGGTPGIHVTTDRTLIKWTDAFTRGRVYRKDNVVHIINSGVQLENLARTNHERLVALRNIEHASGAAISVNTTTRTVAVTAGKFWIGSNPFDTVALDSAGADTIGHFYRNGSGGWTESTVSVVDNVYYDDSTGTLHEATNNQYVVQYFYHDYGGYPYMQYGQDSYKLAEAQEAKVPDAPSFLDDFAVLRGRVIYKKGVAAYEELVAVEDERFVASTAMNHNDTGGLNTGNYHHAFAPTVVGCILYSSDGVNWDGILSPGTVNQVLTMKTATELYWADR